MDGPIVVDIYSGVGGFSLGAHLAGFSVPLMIDVDPDVTASHAKNFPISTLLLADASHLEPAVALKQASLEPEKIAGLIGGPPCQGFSYIGSRNPEDPRNRLVSHFYRFVEAIRPAFFVMENVPGILNDGLRTVLDASMESIAPWYHILGPIPVNAADFGAATVRKRVLVMGIRSEMADPLPEDCIDRIKVKATTTVRHAIADLPSPTTAEADDLGEYWARYKDKAPQKPQSYSAAARKGPPTGLGTAEVRKAHRKNLISGFKPTMHTEAVLARFGRVKAGARDDVSRCPRLAWDSPCPTLRAGTGKDRGSFQSIRPIHPQEDRVITIREAARLQGFPDWFQFHATNWHSFRMIGNSVSPYLSRAVLRVIRQHLQRHSNGCRREG